MACEKLREKTIITRVRNFGEGNHFMLLKIPFSITLKKPWWGDTSRFSMTFRKKKTLPCILRFMPISNMFKCEINVHPREGELWCHRRFCRWPLLGGCQRNRGRLEETREFLPVLLLISVLIPILFIVTPEILLLRTGLAFCPHSSNCLQSARWHSILTCSIDALTQRHQHQPGDTHSSEGLVSVSSTGSHLFICPVSSLFAS